MKATKSLCQAQGNTPLGVKWRYHFTTGLQPNFPVKRVGDCGDLAGLGSAWHKFFLGGASLSVQLHHPSTHSNRNPLPPLTRIFPGPALLDFQPPAAHESAKTNPPRD